MSVAFSTSENIVCDDKSSWASAWKLFVLKLLDMPVQSSRVIWNSRHSSWGSCRKNTDLSCTINYLKTISSKTMVICYEHSDISNKKNWNGRLQKMKTFQLNHVYIIWNKEGRPMNLKGCERLCKLWVF